MNVVDIGDRLGEETPANRGRRSANRLLGNENVRVSFEFFPPHTPALEQKLWRSIKRLQPLNPLHVAITSGGDPVTRQRTKAIVARLCSEARLNVAAHVTCRNNSRDALDRDLHELWRSGVRQLVAIRGDAVNGGDTGPAPDGYDSVVSLLDGIRKVAPFHVTVAAYPEKHPLAATASADLDALKRKIDAGAASAITQYFFNNDSYFRFLDRAHAAGIAIPIIPGLLPIHSLAQVMQVSARCSVSIPPDLAHRLHDLGDDRETRRYEVAAFSAEQILNLVRRGVSQIHFFTLNRADLVYGICHMIGLRASGQSP